MYIISKYDIYINLPDVYTIAMNTCLALAKILAITLSPLQINKEAYEN